MRVIGLVKGGLFCVVGLELVGEFVVELEGTGDILEIREFPELFEVVELPEHLALFIWHLVRDSRRNHIHKIHLFYEFLFDGEKGVERGLKVLTRVLEGLGPNPDYFLGLDILPNEFFDRTELLLP